MEKEQRFGMCRRAQLFYENTGDEKAYKRWKILEGRIIDAGELEEYEAWYKKNQDMAITKWNAEQKKREAAS